ncbi:polysaccharide biosynthesis/export family protein [candidate division WOR-3 bacterium]|nr:polysaccharide biosynthesis/export family protein [candidate division WOR-3 bacterium]
MKKLFVLLLLFSFISAQSIIPSGNVVDPEESDSPNQKNQKNQISQINQTSERSEEENQLTNSPNQKNQTNQTNQKNQIPEGNNDTSAQNALNEPNAPNVDIYLIESGDLLEIVILGEEELSRTLMVMHNGTISFPLIGEIKVAGLTTEQAVELLVEKLKKYFTHPVVSIIFKSPTLPYVSVFGEVLRQGAVEYQRGLRVTDYIALAGGPSSKANLGKVKVVRLQTETSLVETINVNEILNKGLMEKNFELKSGDWIHVSKKFSINWIAVLQFATLTLTALNLYITIDRLNE